ncbi:hypothetical protein CMU51_00095 [Elizabethkingia anophelis]|uniref:Uncharacterized protein n=1 Tax=Elizabethkingia anophelis TaxID=1117645 RepID=A0AAE4NV11_9FLAO|nr:hypothetical protein [Elizabethkingia anophelis]
MKKFKLAELDDLLKQVHREEITFSKFVEIINKRIVEKPESTPLGRLEDTDYFKDHMKKIEEQRKLGKL